MGILTTLVCKTKRKQSFKKEKKILEKIW